VLPPLIRISAPQPLALQAILQRVDVSAPARNNTLEVTTGTLAVGYQLRRSRNFGCLKYSRFPSVRRLEAEVRRVWLPAVVE
jgi:hypothetical protein